MRSECREGREGKNKKLEEREREGGKNIKRERDKITGEERSLLGSGVTKGYVLFN